MKKRSKRRESTENRKKKEIGMKVIWGEEVVKTSSEESEDSGSRCLVRFRRNPRTRHITLDFKWKNVQEARTKRVDGKAGKTEELSERKEEEDTQKKF